MNSLSWLIYLTQVTSTINVVAGAMAIIIGVLLGFGGFMTLLFWEELSESQENIAKKMGKNLFVLWVITFILFAFFPSQRTMLLIAGSEISERIANNSKVQNVIDPSVDLLKNWIAMENKKVLKELNRDQ